MKRFFSILLGLVCGGLFCTGSRTLSHSALFAADVCATTAASDGPGLTVKNGMLLHEGRPCRAIGVNYPSLFTRTLVDHHDTSYRAGLRRLAEAGIPWARFWACGFWPSNWDLYRKDKAAYFALMDQVVRAAEQEHVGLIASLFWYWATVPDMMGEPMDQLGNRASKSIAFIRKYTEEVVSRYKDSPAIWGWEAGNEYNLAVDLPAGHGHPFVAPHMKTPAARGEHDYLTSSAMLVVFDEFARAVRRCDPRRIIVSGNAVPRSCAFHNTLERSWKRDTPEQFAAILRRDNPDPIDTICVHIYPNEYHPADEKPPAKKAHRREPYPGESKSLDELIKAVCRDAAQLKKPAVVGEFGSVIAGDPVRERQIFEELLAAIQRNPVALAAVWVYDFPPHDALAANITFDNARAYQLKLIGKANTSLLQAPEK